jgi:hypothetical protein
MEGQFRLQRLMAKVLTYLLELGGVGGIVALLAFIPWTKLALGGVLAFLGAFFPNFGGTKVDRQGGYAQIKVLNILLKMSGGLRFGLVLAGLIVLVGAILDGHQGYVANQANTVPLAEQLKQQRDEEAKRIQEMVKSMPSQDDVWRQLLSKDDLKRMQNSPESAHQ